MYLMEDIRKAMRLYNYVLEHGELTAADDRELFQHFSEASVREILEAFEEETRVKIRKYDDTIYFMPDVDNEFLGYKRSELKREIFTRADMKNIDLFLAMYIMLQLTAEFYSGKGNMVKIRDLIQLGELDEKITERLELFLESEERGADEGADVDVATGLVISDIARHWFTLVNEDNAAVIRTRRWYISQVMSFLKKEELISIQDETVIIPTSKFNRLAANYFLNFERLEDINRILKVRNEVTERDA
jgi:hypothetical protein